MNKTTLILNNISKEYKQGSSVIQILNNINLIVMKGETIAIIGSSGSGKSTLLHIAGLLDNPNHGEVIIPGLTKQTQTMIRLHHIGFIYQQHHLLKDFSARENIALPRLIANNNYEDALNKADQLLAELGLNKQKHNMPGELSGGQQQRVAIARSLVNNPKIILADEPTGNLDPITANETFNLLLKVADQQNTSIIMVTHNHEMAQKMNKLYELKCNTLHLIDK